MNTYPLSPSKITEYTELFLQRQKYSSDELENAIRATLKFADTLAEISPNPIYIRNIIADKYEYFNSAITKMLGYEVETVLNCDSKWAHERIHPDDISRIIEQHLQGVAKADSDNIQNRIESDKTIYEYNYRMRHEITGEWRNIIQRAIIFERTSTGKVMRILGTMYDVTDILKAEESLKQSLKREKVLLEIQLEQKRKELETLTVNLIHRNSMLREFHKKISDILLLPREEVFSELQHLQRSIQNTISNELEWSQLNTLFQEVHPGFKNNLLAHAPNLTHAEIKVCYLLKLQLTTKEIANLLHISTRTVEDTRLNIRKKLKISEKLNSFLQNL